MSVQPDSKRAGFKPRRALIVVKQTLKARAESSDNEHLRRLLDPAHEEHERMVASDREHNLTLRHVVSVLTDHDITPRCLKREPGEHFALRDEEDMVVTVGGDGTFLDASHSVVSRVPMLGVNSAPATSVGKFCLTNRAGFEKVLASILGGKLKPVSLLRLKAVIDDETVSIPLLNELLVAHSHPAATNRYKIAAEGKTAEHKSSGVLIATPSGSTGFMRSEGGPVLDITDEKLAYWVRAPYRQPGTTLELRGGVLKRTDKIVITSQMTDGFVYLDGEHIERSFPHGSILTVSAHEQDLLAYIDPRCNDRFNKESMVGSGRHTTS